MRNEPAFAEVFDRLAMILAPYRDRLNVKVDEPGHLYLETGPSSRYQDGLYFGMVKTGKRYVGYHLMPVYTHPALLDDASPGLRKRMQGKSCFNFTRVDETLFAELARLTEAGFARYVAEELIPDT